MDYIDYWWSLLSFGSSLKNSILVEYNSAYFRKRNSQLYLCTYDCSGVQLMSTLLELIKDGYTIKSWGMVHKNFTGLPIHRAYIEWYVPADYSVEYVVTRKGKAARGNKVLNKYNNGLARYTVVDQSTFTYHDALSLFEKWRKFAAPRHFMVTIGHYLEYLRLAYTVPDTAIRLLGFVDANGVLFGISGWEVAPNGTAQFTFMKHLSGDNDFSTFFWIRSIEEILKDTNITKVLCGSTADDLKARLEMTPEIAYKIDMKSIGGQDYDEGK
jgi:hypothetical protein